MPSLVPIETKRLLLRDWETSDAPSAYEYASDPIVVRFMPWGPNTLSQTPGLYSKGPKTSFCKTEAII